VPDKAVLIDVEMDDGPSGGVVGIHREQSLQVVRSHRTMVDQLLVSDISEMRALEKDMKNGLPMTGIAPLAIGRSELLGLPSNGMQVSLL
jgi:hypothetical protein